MIRKEGPGLSVREKFKISCEDKKWDLVFKMKGPNI